MADVFCNNCGHRNPPEANFCSACGAALVHHSDLTLTISSVEAAGEVHEPDVNQRLLDQALEVFYAIRGMDRLRKKPSTSELVDWIAMLQAIEMSEVGLSADLPFLGTLLKKEQDLAAFLDATSGGGFRRRM